MSNEPDTFAALIEPMMRHAPLPHAENMALIERAQTGDADALDRLVRHNSRLIQRFASRFSKLGDHVASADDCFQVAAMGFVEAVLRFDTSMGYRLSTYVVHYVRKTVSRYIGNCGSLIRTPIHALEAFKTAAADLTPGDFRGLRESARARGLDPDSVELVALTRWGHYAPVGAPLTEESDRLFEIEDERPTGHVAVEAEATVSGWLASAGLTARERTVIGARYSDDEPGFQEIGRGLGISRERVRQIEGNALKKLRRVAAVRAC